jgi:hypothetical protein
MKFATANPSVGGEEGGKKEEISRLRSNFRLRIIPARRTGEPRKPKISDRP